MGIYPAALYSKLLEDLCDQLPDQDFQSIRKNPGLLWAGISFKSAAASSIAKSFLRKWEADNSTALDTVAWNKFVTCNNACENWVLTGDHIVDELLLGQFREELHRFWFVDGLTPLASHPYDLLFRGRVGPGASLGSRGGDFYTKFFSSELTCTSPFLYDMYKRYIWNFPEWSSAELIRATNFGDPRVVSGNRLTFVPKNVDTSRTICTEPSLNMFYQLGFSHILEHALESKFGIKLSHQQFKNRELARLGSAYGSFSTIDLESASDTISLRMLREFLPRGFLSILEMLRSRSTTSSRGELTLNMVSTMGNGYTFALQTAIFTCAVLSALKIAGVEPQFPRGQDLGNFGVNGDDIIVPSGKSTRLLIRLIELLGFRVNGEKSFVEGPFRESCGSDFFLGRNIRGVYLKRLDTRQDSFSVINQLNLFSTRTGVYFPKLIADLIKQCGHFYVPRFENDDAGIKVPYSMVRNPLVDRDTQSTLYFKYEPVGLKIRIKDRKLHVPKSLKSRIFNPSGLHIAFLQGGINSHSIGSRQRTSRYVKRYGVAPYWDATPTVHPLAGWFNWQRWETAVYLNLFG